MGLVILDGIEEQRCVAQFSSLGILLFGIARLEIAAALFPCLLHLDWILGFLRFGMNN